MRRVLIDHAREPQAAKRPGAHLKVLLDDGGMGAAQPPACEFMMMDEGLVELARIDPRQSQIVELGTSAGYLCLCSMACWAARTRSRASHTPVIRLPEPPWVVRNAICASYAPASSGPCL